MLLTVVLFLVALVIMTLFILSGMLCFLKLKRILLLNCRDNEHYEQVEQSLFRLFDPSDSHMGEEISTTCPTDFEESLILTRRISLWKSNSVPKTSRSLNTVRHHALSDLCLHIPFYAIQAKAVFYEIVRMFLVRQVSMK